MREYSPRRRTALVLPGSGTSGAYHAGVLKALDECGVKIDLVVGTGMGAVAAVFAAAAGGARLYGEGGFWDGAEWRRLYRTRLAIRVTILLLACSFGVFLLPLLAAVLAGVLFLPLTVADLVAPGMGARAVETLGGAPALLRAPYLAALSAPVFLLCVVIALGLLRTWARDRRRMPELLEFVVETGPGAARLGRLLWEVARGSAVSQSPPREAEIGRRYVALVEENLGEPGFRELILRTADLDSGGVLPFVLLGDEFRAAFTAARARGPRSRLDGMEGAVDLRAPGYDTLLFDAVAAALAAPGVAAPRRLAFPKGGIHAGEVHRLVEGTIAAGCGIAEALDAGAEQVIVATAVPEAPGPLPRRRGARALVDGVLATLERQSVDADLRASLRLNRVVETLGHRTEDGARAWQDPTTGHTYRAFGLYVIRPERRVLGPLEHDGARDPATEVVETSADLGEQGYRDAYRLFVEPVLGAAPEPPVRRGTEPTPAPPQAVEL